jgi:predicted Holliday junction resolvase-like endonuclease
VQLLVIAIVVLVVLILLTNTKRWRALSRGARKSRRDLEQELKAAERER